MPAAADNVTWKGVYVYTYAWWRPYRFLPHTCLNSPTARKLHRSTDGSLQLYQNSLYFLYQRNWLSGLEPVAWFMPCCGCVMYLEMKSFCPVADTGYCDRYTKTEIAQQINRQAGNTNRILRSRNAFPLRFIWWKDVTRSSLNFLVNTAFIRAWPILCCNLDCCCHRMPCHLGLMVLSNKIYLHCFSATGCSRFDPHPMALLINFLTVIKAPHVESLELM